MQNKQQTQGKQTEIQFQWSLKLQEYNIAQMYPKITVSPNCNSLAINDQINKEIIILGIPNKQILGELNLFKIKADVQTVSYSPDSQYLIVQYREFLLLNNLENQKQLVKIDRIRDTQSIKIKTYKTQLFLLNQFVYDALIQIFNLTSGERTGQFLLKTNDISYSPLCQNCIVMNVSNNFSAYQIIIYNFIKEKKVKLIGLIKLGRAYNYDLKFRKYFTVFTTNNLIKIYQLQRFKLIRKISYQDDDIFYQSSSCYCNIDLIVIIFSQKKYYQINCLQIKFKKGFLPGRDKIDYFYPYPSKIVKKNAREVEIIIYK